MDVKKLINSLNEDELKELKGAVLAATKIQDEIKENFDFETLSPSLVLLAMGGEKLKFCRAVCEWPERPGLSFALRLYDAAAKIAASEDDDWVLVRNADGFFRFSYCGAGRHESFAAATSTGSPSLHEAVGKIVPVLTDWLTLVDGLDDDETFILNDRGGAGISARMARDVVTAWNRT